MKHLFTIICLSAFVWSGCKENNALIVYPGPTAVQDSTTRDTTYVLAAGSIPAAQPHNVLIEEFTGQSCSNCPAAHSLLASIAEGSGNAGRINIVSMYLQGGPQTYPPNGAKFNFTDSIVTQISSSIYPGINALPSGGIDRAIFNSNMVLYTSEWSTDITTQKALVNPLNLSLTSSYNATTNKATITVFVTYITPVTIPQNLSVIVVEDSMFDLQEDGITIDTGYLFRDVFRAMITAPPFGDPLPDAKEAGRVYRRMYTYTPVKHKIADGPITPSHLRVIAFINNANGSDKQVIQSQGTKLMGP
jgi:hypothetical protein